VLENDALDGFLKGFQNIANHMGFPEVTLQSTAILFVFVIYAFTMLVLVIINNATVDQYPPKHIPKRLGLFVSLVASGLLSAAGGVIGLIEYGQAPVPCRPVGDLVIPAAALLAGGLYLAGPKRTLLVCLLLPASLAVASAWRQDVLSLRSDYLPGFPLQVGVLIVMVAMSRYAMTGASKTSNRRDLALVMAWLSSLGIVVFAACVWFDSPTIRTIAHLLGAGFWLVGAVGAISLRFLPKRRSAW
jgi:FtsH-binding integral membrane protein